VTIFGPLITTVDIDEAVLDTLKLWLPTYLTETERDKVIGHDWLADPKSYANVLDDDTFPDFVLPAVLVTTSGTIGDTERIGGGYHNAWWSFVVTAIVRGPDEAGSRRQPRCMPHRSGGCCSRSSRSVASRAACSGSARLSLRWRTPVAWSQPGCWHR
jgi:hypothetical protein